MARTKARSGCDRRWRLQFYFNPREGKPTIVQVINNDIVTLSINAYGY